VASPQRSEFVLPRQKTPLALQAVFSQRVKKASKQECHCEEPPKRRRRGNPHPLKPAVLGALSAKTKHFGERIATP